ncbi:hypothetical protein CEP50_19140 [Actinopolyspora mortivallis]|uniref:Pentapeptide repeat-containing protein n=1 Tax=Actinopolyspora mortivallis TaxID=33906 RepID=A0A2T0GRK4_ACTMO|nr:hypothetical protein CEP50_19140 [Actinopolyspora mortivallis]
MRPSTWTLLGGGVLLVLGLAAWVPVEWAALAVRLGGTLASWGVFSLPALVTACGAGVVLASALPRGRARGRRKDRTEARAQARPLRWWIVVLVALGILAATGLALLWLMGLAGQARPQDVPKARIEAVRTAMTLGAGLVGMSVLVLTGRKQWLAERTQRHTETDAAEQRVTELYTAAAQQLASENAPVRMAGLYALSRLGQNNPGHRQTIVNLFCAYLRMPYTPPDVEEGSSQQDRRVPRRGLRRPDRGRRESSPLATLLTLAPTLTATNSQLADDDYRRQELQVRLTAQGLLNRHLRPELDESGRATNKEFWADMDLDLEGATLYRWDMRDCRVRHVNFTRAEFHSSARFDGAGFHSSAWFAGAGFHDSAWFAGAGFHGPAWFDGAGFHGPAWFAGAGFHGLAWFDGAGFHERTHFGRAWLRLDHEASIVSSPPPGWVIRERDPGDGREGRWGELVPAEDAAQEATAPDAEPTDPDVDT